MLNILKKELKDSFRDQRTLLLTVLLPLILMSALVFFYENMMTTNEEDTYNIVVEQSQLNFLSTLLADTHNLKLRAVEDIEQTLKDGEAIAGIILPSDFEEQILVGKAPNVQILGNQYSENSVIAMTTIEMAFTQYSQTIVANRLGEQNIEMSVLTPFVMEKVQVVEGNQSVMMISFLVPMMLIIAVGVGISSSAADFIAGEKERRTMEALLMTPVNRSALLFAKWLTLIIIAISTGIITLAIVFVEIYFFTEQLKAGLALDNNVLIIAVLSLTVVISLAALMASALMLTSILAKTVKEAQSYGTPIIMVGILPALLTTNLGINELTSTHFLIPILNFFAIFKELFYGVVNVEHILLTISINLFIAIIVFFVGRVLFMKDKWILAS